MKRNFLFLFLALLFFISPVKAQQKTSIAVLNLKNAAQVSKGEVDIISDRLRIELFKTGNVDVMEREQMQDILKEQGFQASGACTDEACMVEMGQLLGVQRLVTGSMGKLGSLYLLNLRTIDVTTAKIIKVVSVDIKGGIEEVVGELSKIAWGLTSTESKKTKPKQAEIKPVQEVEEEEEEEEEEESDLPPECDETVFLESVNFKGMINFTLEKETVDEINEEIKYAIEEAVEEEIDDDLDVEIVTLEQIAKLPDNCNSGIARVSLDSYSTEKSGSQFIGIATATFYFYSNTRTQKHSFQIKISEEGARHWGDQQPIINAFAEIAEELEDKLEDSDYIHILYMDK